MTKPAIIMQYRLLRNNKESGPYTKAQLEEMGLKPYDLLWIEGRGGAWLYASEIEELKSIAPTVEEQPYDRFYKGKEKQTAAADTGKQATAFAGNNNNANTSTTSIKQPKPRFRISGDKVVMIDNAALQQPKPVQDALSAITNAKAQQPATATAKPVVKQEIGAHIQSAGLGWEDMYSNWKGDDKQTEEKPAPVKRQTMEEVKQRFEEARLKQLNNKQHKTASTAKQNVMAAAAVLVLIIGGYAGYKMNKSSSSRTTQDASAVEKAEVLPSGDGQQPNTTDVDASTGSAATPQQSNSNGEEIKSSLNNTPVSSLAENKPRNTDNKKEEIAASGKSTLSKADQKKAEQEQSKSSKSDVASTKATKDNSTDYDIKRTTVPVAAEHIPTATEPNVVKQPNAPSKKINDYITVSRLGSSNNSGSVQNVLLAVKNVTDFPIDLAVIDIQYFGANGRFQKGETMYVKNIDAGSSINVRIPDGRDARSISYKVSLVSSEQKTLYLVGD